MNQRVSGYARMPGDTYVTPRWVYEALYTVEPWASGAWDCAPVNAEFDFLKMNVCAYGIATNPPFNLAQKFCHHALILAARVAMLLPMGFDSAKSRRDLFADCQAFKAKYTLLERVRWENLEQKKNGPSSNHAWYVWDKEHRGPATMGWL